MLLFFSYLFVEILNLFMHSFPDLSELTAIILNWGNSLISISITLVSGELFFCLGHIPVSSFSLILYVDFCALDRIATFPLLTDWSHVRYELCQSAWPKFLVSSQTFVIIQVTLCS